MGSCPYLSMTDTILFIACEAEGVVDLPIVLAHAATSRQPCTAARAPAGPSSNPLGRILGSPGRVGQPLPASGVPEQIHVELRVRCEERTQRREAAHVGARGPGELQEALLQILQASLVGEADGARDVLADEQGVVPAGGARPRAERLEDLVAAAAGRRRPGGIRIAWSESSMRWRATRASPAQKPRSGSSPASATTSISAGPPAVVNSGRAWGDSMASIWWLLTHALVDVLQRDHHQIRVLAVNLYPSGLCLLKEEEDEEESNG